MLVQLFVKNGGTDVQFENIVSIKVNDITFTDENINDFLCDDTSFVVLIGSDAVHYIAPGTISHLTIKKLS